MFGIKMKTVKTQQAYTLQEFFEVIRNHDFPDAGRPSWEKNGMAHVIAFAPVDSRNQVWISQPVAADYMNKKSNKFLVLRSSYNTGFDNFLENQYLDRVTLQISWLKATYGSNEKVCEKQVEAIWNELNSMGL